MLELGWPLPRRREFLKEKSSEKSDQTHPVPFQGKMQYLPIHQVPLGLPLYRLENGRTTGKQAEYLSAHPEVSKEFFRLDNESATAQKAQHKILTELASGPKNLFKEFETEPQIEPIILTSLGYVVNGNRRLSTWRDLYDSDASKYDRFRNIQVVILPLVDDKEIDRVEADLQLKEDLKADYSWTATALMMREKMSRYGYDEDELVALYTRDKKDLIELLDSLDYAEQYLAARDIPSKYSEVDAKEYAFIQMVRTRKRWKASEAQKEVFEKSAFCLTDEAGEGKRIYSEIPKLADHLGEVVESLSDEFEIEIKGAEENTALAKVAEALDKKENFETARIVIRDAIEAAVHAKKNQKKKDYVVSTVQKARSLLSDAKASIEPESAKNGISQTLDDIEALVEDFRAWAADNGE
ncbi:hypothetical protein [Bradyrhizobium sp.]|uniref:hypothetical protein n=1 Tax=Bradyrhizobium sp. TaxID=376 RepID=UPI0026157B83|nr:hypothetical protein [Bradyrhizobium sp.]